jgi:heme-degrading monooxygenase HmoA
MNQFITIWEYKVKPEKKEEFEKLYGQDGDWVRLFHKFPDYIKTEFIKDLNNNDLYLTLDYWKSKEAYNRFKETAKEKFSEIDKKGEKLTLEEKHIGEFQTFS